MRSADFWLGVAVVAIVTMYVLGCRYEDRKRRRQE
jgi:hypothetical protein